MKNLILVIPTHARVNRQITLGALPTTLQPEAILVSSTPEEAKELRRLHPNNEVLTAKVASIAEKRHWIMKNLASRKKLIFMMDDDVAFFERCPAKWRVWEAHRKAYALHKEAPAGTALMMRLYPKDKRLLMLFQDLDRRVSSHDPAMLGIAHRRHSDKKKESWEINARMMYAFGVDPVRYNRLKIRFDAVRCREDFHVTLCMLKAGQQGHNYVELLNNEYGAFNSAGGASTERTMEFSNAQCDLLAKLHHPFVKVMDRAYKGSIPRKEVVIAWKKAYASSGAIL